MAQRFAFRFARSYRPAAAVFGVRPRSTGIVVADGQLRVRFGPWQLATDLANVERVAVTGPYAWLKTAGPARLGITDRGLTFATNGERGVLLEFREPITGIDPFGLVRHPNLTLTADDCDGLAAAVTAG